MKSHGEFGAFSIFTFHEDVSVHNLGDMTADSHAETGPLDIANGLIIRPLERFEYFFQKFRFHSYAVIRYGYFKLGVTVIDRRLLFYRQLY